MSIRSTSRKPYHYSAFGLEIESELACPELLPHDRGGDLRIQFGDVPESLPHAKVVGEDFQLAGDRFLFKIPAIAGYLINEGREIIIAPSPGADITLVRLYLLGSVMGILLHLRGLLPLHASAIEYRGRGIAFLGASGHGKSTLAQALRQRGYRILADDICAVALDRQEPPRILPGYSNLKLPRDSARMLETRIPRNVFAIAEEAKYSLPLERDYHSEALPLERAYLLEPSPVSHCHIRELRGSRKLMPLIYNTYRARVLPAMGLRDAHFARCIALSRQCRVGRVTRPLEPFLLDELVSVLEADFSNSPVSNRWASHRPGFPP